MFVVCCVCCLLFVCCLLCLLLLFSTCLLLVGEILVKFYCHHFFSHSQSHFNARFCFFHQSCHQRDYVCKIHFFPNVEWRAHFLCYVTQIHMIKGGTFPR
eukprot:Lithocolla_globosa_v1_NODE_1515_length_2519_cov_63.243101.p3 type:complete len:100 gc:universal NODE_1515_length_2519_cov_63.243101:281-580(+)